MKIEERAKVEALKILEWVHGDKTASPNFVTDTITRLLDEKDKRVKEYLEEKRFHYAIQRSNTLLSNDYEEYVRCDAVVTALDKIINELFKD